MPSYIGAIDQGTTSARFLIFEETGRLVTQHQVKVEQIYPRAGWIEHDPYDLLDSVIRCADEAIRKFGLMGYDPSNIKAVGVTNQRETVLAWNRKTGEPLYNAIGWADTRTDKLAKQFAERQDADIVQPLSGLPIHNYFSALKMVWLIRRVQAVKEAIEKDRALFGTVDSWLIWNLTGGAEGGRHITDVTNASRTMLMNVKTLQWEPELLKFFGIPDHVLPTIVSSSEHYGNVRWGPLEGIPIMGCLGDQHAALVGQKCFQPGEAKNTYGTGAFLLLNVGSEPVFSKNGSLTTVAYQLGRDGPMAYALEGSIGAAGAAIQWLRDNMGIINKPEDIDALASQVKDTGGVVFVTAFSGLFAPYWRDDARGTLVGLTQYTNKRHIARATLEATCLSTRVILDAMKKDSNLSLKVLKADGGMSKSDVCMQMQADVLSIPVVRPAMRETTCLGAAFAAGLAAGVWKDMDDLRNIRAEDEQIFNSKLNEHEQAEKLQIWEAAIQRSCGWTAVYQHTD
ncbi:Glycerol kinase [Apophysomyces ossiformis]|uniref:Probable glycerol kinase n=1 Tax=Apophysomyces ossiformis TaxID=679940 RepID=A0A8H7BJ60_9FUNG|nr:Glycerol kinase [Apophysomyces ossiformis]